MSDLIDELNSDYAALGAKTDPTKVIQDLPLDRIAPDPDQVRTSGNAGFKADSGDPDLGSLDDLKNSIKDFGLKTPIVVRRLTDDEIAARKKEAENAAPGEELSDALNPNAGYMIVSGERRYRACRDLGLDHIPAIVREYKDLADVRLEQIIENIQRVGLTQFEIANFVKSFRENWKKNHGGKTLTSAEMGRMLGKPRSWMTMVESFTNVPEEIRKYFEDGKISPSLRVGYELLKLYVKHPEEVAEWMQDLFTDPAAVVNNTNLANLRDYVAFKTGGRRSKTVAEPEEENDSEDLRFSGSEENGADDQDEENSSDAESEDPDDDSEYTESPEKEHSAEPSMAPSHQENNAPTAGLGKPDFTERDTRPAGDLADHADDSGAAERDEADAMSAAAGIGSEDHGVIGLRCVFADPESGDEEEYTVDLTVLCDDPSHLLLVSSDGSTREVPMQDVRLTEAYRD